MVFLKKTLKQRIHWPTQTSEVEGALHFGMGNGVSLEEEKIFEEQCRQTLFDWEIKHAEFWAREGGSWKLLHDAIKQARKFIMS